MNKICRLGDKAVGNCSVHGFQNGTIITCSDKLFDSGIGVARIGDVVLADCGHTGIISICSDKTFDNDKGVARVTDSFDGIYSGTLVTGSNKSNSN